MWCGEYRVSHADNLMPIPFVFRFVSCGFRVQVIKNGTAGVVWCGAVQCGAAWLFLPYDI